MSVRSEPRLPFDEPLEGASGALGAEPRPVAVLDDPDRRARTAAVDPARNVVLEASAGTGKTRVLVDRYVNLLGAGVDPDHILAITFTRKAAAEMRERIAERLRENAASSSPDAARWRDLRHRLGDIVISTIDAFCMSLLREFPLEADVDPAFELADPAEVARLVSQSLDRAMRICRTLARDDEDVALVFAQLGERRLRLGLAALLDRRLVAPQALKRILTVGPRELTAAIACRRAAGRLGELLGGVRGGLQRFLDDGPLRRPRFAMLARDLGGLVEQVARGPADEATANGQGFETGGQQAALRALLERVRAYFLTQDGRPRGERFSGTGFGADDCRTADAWRRHRVLAAELAPGVAETVRAFRRDLNAIMSRGVWRVFAVAVGIYQRTLDGRSLLDFPGVLERAVDLLKNLDEFAESRFRLEARFRHVLVDEFQDTSRSQWELVSSLVRNWGEGLGASADALPPSIFIVGDRKQSIYGFRDADGALLDEAAAFIAALGPDQHPSRAISVSFRATSGILAFVNDLFLSIEKNPRPDGFRYEDSDRFPVDQTPGSEQAGPPDPPLGMIVGRTVTETAERVAAEIGRLLRDASVRERATGANRPAHAGDIAILFRARDTHREFEKALARSGVPTCVYKGLGFFDSDEIQDVVALLRYLADPWSDMRAASLLRSRIVRLSDAGLACLAPHIAAALLGQDGPPEREAGLSDEDRRVLSLLRQSIPTWLSLVDRLTPTELLNEILRETAYAAELGGSRYLQARENLKKLRFMVRRFQNRGYATLSRLADHLDELALGDESSAVLDAREAVSLMTVHAAKGLEFPIVFVVNLGRGTGTTRAPIRVSVTPEPSVAIADYQSEADEDLAARDREETKRLLYVAVTRARDRLYLSASVDAGVCRTTRGSLGEVLPASLKAAFVEAAAPRTGSVIWSGPGGRRHVFRLPASS
jgi:ATP-dependent helicase/nuclease subunit A